ncbi:MULTISPECIES: FUSC family protein [Gordonia]|uniref:FUSC family protein n=1 Tax=Gordonia TaxID=2053 RepID=UPI0033991EB7
MTTDLPGWQPTVWMRALLATPSATWPLGRSIRGAVTVAAPVTLGALTGHPLVGMWISMGTLLLAAGEKSVAYRARFRQFATTTPLAAAAYFLGVLSTAPAPVTVAVMAVIAGVSGIVSGYSGTVSVATMQAMVIAAIAIGVPAARPYWEPAVLFLAGAVLYAAGLAVEVAISRSRPQRDSLVTLLRSLSVLARAQAAGNTDLAVERAQAISALDAFDHMAITGRGTAGGPTPEYDRAAAISRAADQLMARLLADDADRDLSTQTAPRLAECAAALTHRRRPGARPPDGTLIRLGMLEDAIFGDAPSPVSTAPPERTTPSPPGPALLASAGRLALCTAIAYAMYFVLPVAHGYWIALTVALVMKPDLGSVFGRAVLRGIGTVGGACVAVAVGVLPHQPIISGLVIAVLAATLPWAMTRSYLGQALVLTPLIMILLDVVVPHASILHLSEARVATTVIGCVIVIVVGYLVWPGARRVHMVESFGATLTVLARYAQDVAGNASPDVVTADRRIVYRRLSDARTSLQRNLSEPPPAGAEAWAWIPVVSATERVADRVTSASAARTPPATTPDADELSVLAGELADLDHQVTAEHRARRTPTPPARAAHSPDPAVRELADELAHLRSLIGRESRPAPHELDSTTQTDRR